MRCLNSVFKRRSLKRRFWLTASLFVVFNLIFPAQIYAAAIFMSGTFIESSFPANLFIEVEDGLECTDSREIILTIQGDNADWVVLDNTYLFLEGVWQEFAGEQTLEWKLSEGDGEKNVYAMFRGINGALSTAVYDSIILDTAGKCELWGTSEFRAAQGYSAPVAEPVTTEPVSVREATAEAPDVREATVLLGSTESAAVQAGASEGFVSNIRGSSFPTVYYTTSDSVRRPYLNPTIFATWAGGWDAIEWVDDASLSDHTMGAPMLPRPGVVLVKTQISPKVYWVEEGESGAYVLRWVQTEQDAGIYFGANWADNVVDIDSNLFARYEIGEDFVGEQEFDSAKLLTRQQLRDRL